MHTYKVYASNISILKKIITALKILREVETYFNTLNVRGLKFSISCLFFKADLVIIL